MTDEREIDIQAQVKGLFYRPDEAKQVVETMQPADECTLVREPSNPHDSNAVQVWYKGQHIGYIAREIAGEVAEHMDNAIDLYAEVYYFLSPTTPVLQIIEQLDEEPDEFDEKAA